VWPFPDLGGPPCRFELPFIVEVLGAMGTIGGVDAALDCSVVEAVPEVRGDGDVVLVVLAVVCDVVGLLRDCLVIVSTPCF